MNEQNYQIERGITKILVPHQNGKLTVAYPFYGPNIAKNLRDQIKANETVRLIEPTLGEVVSFICAAYGNNKEPKFREANKIMRERYFRGFTATHYDPSDKRLDAELVYVVDIHDFNGNGTARVNNDDLVKRLKRRDKSVRTIPKSEINGGTFKPKELAKNAYFIALVGDAETAEKGAEIASRHPKKESYLLVPDFSAQVTRTAALLSDFDGNRLLIDGCDYELDRDGYAFGVFAEGDAKKI